MFFPITYDSLQNKAIVNRLNVDFTSYVSLLYKRTSIRFAIITSHNFKLITESTPQGNISLKCRNYLYFIS